MKLSPHRRPPRLLIALAGSLAIVGSARAAECPPLRLLATTDPSVLIAGPHKVRFLSPDDASAPTAWEGPVAVEDATGAPRCTIELRDLIEKPIAAFQDGTLVIATMSGSNVRAVSLDLAGCRVRHTSTSMTGPVAITHGRITAAGQPILGLPCDRIGGDPRYDATRR